MPVLADTGHADVAFELLFERTEPSWLVMIDRAGISLIEPAYRRFQIRPWGLPG